MKYSKQISLLLVAVAMSLSGSARAAKQWDPYTAISFTVNGSDAEMAPSAEGDNGLQTTGFDVVTYSDTDHWIDPNESAPNNEGYPSENLPFGDIDYASSADFWFTSSPLVADGWQNSKSLVFNGWSQDTTSARISGNIQDDFTFASPDLAGAYTLQFTGTDRNQTIPAGDSGNRNDPNNTDNWWDIAP